MVSLDDSMIYRIPDNVREAVLIQGEIQCFHAKEIITAPALLNKSKRIFK